MASVQKIDKGISTLYGRTGPACKSFGVVRIWAMLREATGCSTFRLKLINLNEQSVLY